MPINPHRNPKPPCTVCHDLVGDKSWEYSRRYGIVSLMLTLPIKSVMGTAPTCSFCAILLEGFWLYATDLGYERGRDNVDFDSLAADILVPRDEHDHGACTVAYLPKARSFPNHGLEALRDKWAGSIWEFYLEENCMASVVTVFPRTERLTYGER